MHVCIHELFPDYGGTEMRPQTNLACKAVRAIVATTNAPRTAKKANDADRHHRSRWDPHVSVVDRRRRSTSRQATGRGVPSLRHTTAKAVPPLFPPNASVRSHRRLLKAATCGALPAPRNHSPRCCVVSPRDAIFFCYSACFGMFSLVFLVP